MTDFIQPPLPGLDLPLPPLELATIKARRAAITPTPWILAPDLCGPDGQGIYTEDMGCIVEVGDPYPRDDNRPQENMTFLVHAPDDIAALVLWVERLAEVVRAVQDALASFKRFDDGDLRAYEAWRVKGAHVLLLLKQVAPEVEALTGMSHD